MSCVGPQQCCVALGVSQLGDAGPCCQCREVSPQPWALPAVVLGWQQLAWVPAASPARRAQARRAKFPICHGVLHLQPLPGFASTGAPKSFSDGTFSSSPCWGIHLLVPWCS